MTNEEAIVYWEGLRRTFHDHMEKEENPFGKKHYQTSIEAIDAALSALRPVSREQVEKVWRGCRSCKSCRSCVYNIHDLKDMPCKKCDPNAEGIVTEYKPSNFCTVCGKPLTDEAVEMVMERMEKLYEQTSN